MGAIAEFAIVAKQAQEALKGMVQQMQQMSRGGMNYSALGRAFEVLGQTLGMVLTPILLMFAAGVMTVADIFGGNLKDNLVAFADAMVSVVEQVISFGSAVYSGMDKFKKWEEGIGDWIASKIYGEQAVWRPSASPGGAASAVDPNTGSGEKLDFRKTMADNMKGMAQEMRMGMAPTGYSGIADAARKLQTQTFQSTIQQKMLSMFEQTIKVVERVAGGVEKIQPGLP